MVISLAYEVNLNYTGDITVDRLSMIYIASDHRGFTCKGDLISYLKSKKLDLIDLGPQAYSPFDDYVDYAIKVASIVQSNPEDKGILLCGSGIGMYMVANKFAGVRAAEVRTVEEAKIDREHHDSNTLVLGSDILSQGNLHGIVDTWLNTEFSGGRHTRRLKKISFYESEFIKDFVDSVKIVPAILSDELTEYKKRLDDYSDFCNLVHVDIMDDSFVKGKTADLSKILEIASDIDVFLTVHLMVEQPEKYFNLLEKEERVMVVYVHAETISQDEFNKEHAFDLGLVINPDTDIEKYLSLIMKSPVVQIMTIEPGAQGNKFRKDTLSTITHLRNSGYEGKIHIDGSVNMNTIEEIMRFKPDMLNVGSAISNADDPALMYKSLKKKVVRV